MEIKGEPKRSDLKDLVIEAAEFVEKRLKIDCIYSLDTDFVKPEDKFIIYIPIDAIAKLVSVSDPDYSRLPDDRKEAIMCLDLVVEKVSRAAIYQKTVENGILSGNQVREFLCSGEINRIELAKSRVIPIVSDGVTEESISLKSGKGVIEDKTVYDFVKNGGEIDTLDVTELSIEDLGEINKGLLNFSASLLSLSVLRDMVTNKKNFKNKLLRDALNTFEPFIESADKYLSGGKRGQKSLRRQADYIADNFDMVSVYPEIYY